MGQAYGFVEAFLVIFVSEFGDNTFFITAIMAMKHSRLSVLSGSLASLFFMSFLSVIAGYATSVISKEFINYTSLALYVLFGFKMLQEGWHMSADKANEEYEEAQEHLQKNEKKETSPTKAPSFLRKLTNAISSTVFIQCFTLTFLAEWGDRSQIATIVLGAKEDFLGVLLGSFSGNALCTCLAVIGGRYIAHKISIRAVTLLGGALFLLFAMTTLLFHED